MTAPALLGYDLFGAPVVRAPVAPLADRFIFPPFSVLNAREGEWQERKAQWLSLGIKSEIGRADAKVFGIGDKAEWSAGKTNRLAPGGTGANTAWMGVNGAAGNDGQAGTSIFDPVLCELAYRWFSPPGGQVIDPFAGGSVRGIVAAMLGRKSLTRSSVPSKP